MAGAAEAYAEVNSFWSDLFDARVRAWGESRHVHHRLVRGNAAGESASFIEFGLTADDRISQVVAVNYAGDADVLREMVRQRVNISGREELLKDPSAELSALLG
jgi:hypothetical protein